MAGGIGMLEQKKLERIETGLKDLKNLISDFRNENQEWRSSIEGNIRLISEQMESLLRYFNPSTQSTDANAINSPQKPPANGSGNLGHGDGGTAGQQSSSVSENRTLQAMFKLGKINFRFFDGTDSTESVRAWLFHSNMIFQVQNIHDNQKSQIAGLYMKGQALYWLMSYMQNKPVWPLWNEFCDDVIARFDDDAIHTPVMQLKNLNQEGTVMEYQREFERIRSKVKCSEDFATSMFIGGLKDEIRYAVNCHNPCSSMEALRISRLQEAYFDAISREDLDRN